ncbi:MAG: transketolase [Acidobacteria bacterium]|jgi:transketolase|nr:transketolase [Acidobacteriota bacterium]MEB2350019.1 transketolase [Burkholderiaceae bacterium]
MNFPATVDRSSPDLAAVEALATRLRRHVVQMVARLGQGYVAQGLGAADVFAALFGGELRLRGGNPRWNGRDRFILSASHNSALFHAAFAEAGLMPIEALASYCVDGSPCELNVSERLPGVEGTFGSLGQGLSVAVGMALAGKLDGSPWRVYVVLGDGELQEGQVWEATMSAATHRLDNLCMIIDWNEMQVEGHVDKVHRMAPVLAKFEAFGWRGIEVDGHNLSEIFSALAAARTTMDRPTVILAHTKVGMGVPALEGVRSHNMRLPPDVAQRALAELGVQ